MNVPDRLEGAQLLVRGLRADDRDLLFAAASDPLIWEQHPAKSRHERKVFDPYFDFLLESGGAMAVVEKATRRVIGTSRFYIADVPVGAMCIGYTFLTRDHWGGGTNWELKSLMLAPLFEQTDVVWFHISAENLRSQRATAKLGAVRDSAGDTDIGDPATHHVAFRLDRECWQRAQRKEK